MGEVMWKWAKMLMRWKIYITSLSDREINSEGIFRDKAEKERESISSCQNCCQ